jgi:hypothetical protein
MGVSFTPLSSGTLSSSLLGSADPARFTDPLREDARPPSQEALESRRVHGSVRTQAETLAYTVLIIMVSAVIFVTVIAIYDVIKTAVSNHYAKSALLDPESHNKKTDIRRTLVANQAALNASAVFAAAAVGSALLLVPILILSIPKPPLPPRSPSQ